MSVFNALSLEMENKIICYCPSNNLLGLHFNAARLCNAINCISPVNEMQRLIVEKVIYSLNNISNFNCDLIEN